MMSENSIRIRYNATVKELVIPKNQFDVVQKLLNSKEIWNKRKAFLIAATGIKGLCLVCGGVTRSLYQVRYSDPEGLERLEMYCSIHIKSVYEKVKDNTSEEIA